MRRINPSAFRVARRTTSREINRQIALNLVRERQPISRAELARVMGMRRGAVSLLVNQLLQTGQLFEGAKGESKRGRRPTHLYIDTRSSCALAVDINASRTSMLLVDSLGRPLGEVSEFPTRRRPAAQVKELVAHMGPILSRPPGGGPCVGIGVAVSGIVDPERGRLKNSPTLGWRDVDLVTPLCTATGLPVVVENSVKACILAQIWAVTGDPPADGPVVFVNISDGVGVGIAIDGKLLRGAHNIAGEFGHVPLDVRGPACSCGQRGCWEAYVSKRAITARYRGTDPSWAGVTEPGPTVKEIVARARDGEGRARETLRETGYYIGRGFSTLVKAVDPSRVYVGGEITLAWDLVEDTVREAVREHALVPEAGETEIRVVPLGENPRLRGAAALVSAPAFAAPIVA
jgi:predicted NBD/HSP70 family sugar kinase